MNLFKRIAIFFAILIPFSLNAEEIIVLSNGEWEPYLGEKLPHGGPTTRIITDVFNLAGIKTKYIWYQDTWKRAYIDTLNGKEITVGNRLMRVRGSCVWSKSPKREQQMFFSDPIIPAEVNIFIYLKDSGFDWKNINDLKGKRIGATIGYFYNLELEKAAKEGKVILDKIAYEPNNLKRLLTNKIDLFIVNKNIATELIRKKLTPHERSRVAIHPKPASEARSYHLILTKKIPDNKIVLQKFNESLKKLKKAGKLEHYYRNID